MERASNNPRNSETGCSDAVLPVQSPEDRSARTPARTAPPAATSRSNHQPRGHQQCSQIEWIADICVRAAFRQANVFLKMPRAHARNSNPTSDTGNPATNERKSGAENHANASTSTKPRGHAQTRHQIGVRLRETRSSAFVRGGKNCFQCTHHLVRRNRAHACVRLLGSFVSCRCSWGCEAR